MSGSVRFRCLLSRSSIPRRKLVMRRKLTMVVLLLAFSFSLEIHVYRRAQNLNLPQPRTDLSPPDANTRARLNASYGQLPLSFEANQGQADSAVKFRARGSGYQLYLTATEAVLQLRSADLGLRNERTAAGQ